MSQALERETQRRADLIERWGGEASEQLLLHCRELLLNADELERCASAARDGRLGSKVVGCLGETLASLSVAALVLSQESIEGRQLRGQPDPHRLLYAISQNLRFASEAADLCHRTLASAEPNDS